VEEDSVSKAIVFRNHQNEKIYPCPYMPIGSIYLSVNITNPSTYFGGTWEQIKDKSVQYKCRILRDLEKGELPLDMKIDLPLCYFLVDDGVKDGGMFLASAYQHFIGRLVCDLR
jgi:hypothetical protein